MWFQRLLEDFLMLLRKMIKLKCDSLFNAHNGAIVKTIESNKDLHRQIVLLKQQLEERERQIRMLNNLLVKKGKIFNNLTIHFSIHIMMHNFRHCPSKGKGRSKKYVVWNINNAKIQQFYPLSTPT